MIAILTVLFAATGVALVALALTFVIGPIYRATLPRDYSPRYEPTGQTHFNNDLM